GVVFAQRPHHPPSSGDGIAYQRQSRRPVRTSYAVTLPRVGNSPPDVPTMTRSPTTMGAIVMAYAESASATTASHRTAPVVASSATTRASIVPRKTMPWPSATPRLTGPQHGLATPIFG